VLLVVVPARNMVMFGWARLAFRVAVEGEHSQPRRQGGGDQPGGRPGLVEGEQVAGELAGPGVFRGADGVLPPARSTRAWIRWAASMQAARPRQPWVRSGRLATRRR